MEYQYSLQAFRDRTEGFTTYSLPGNGNFETHPGVRAKVSESGKMLPFAGNTIVYELGEELQQLMKELQNILYEQCTGMFAETLISSSCHMTLHDLKNGVPGDEVYRQVDQTRIPALDLLQRIKCENPETVYMRTTRVFNMMNTSVVLGLEPVDDENCRRLMKMYERFREIVPLGYGLTPHMTLAYYKPGVYSEGCLYALAGAFAKCNQKLGQIVELDIENLHYQEFSDMNHYETIE